MYPDTNYLNRLINNYICSLENPQLGYSQH